MPNMTTNHAITYANTQAKGDTNMQNNTENLQRSNEKCKKKP